MPARLQKICASVTRQVSNRTSLWQEGLLKHVIRQAVAALETEHPRILPVELVVKVDVVALFVRWMLHKLDPVLLVPTKPLPVLLVEPALCHDFRANLHAAKAMRC